MARGHTRQAFVEDVGQEIALSIRVRFLIRQLNKGGAQRQSLELINGLDNDRFSVTPLTFYGEEYLRRSEGTARR